MGISVTVATYDTLQEAAIVCGMLRDNGIHAEILNDTNLYVPVFSGTSVIVLERDYERAMKLLKEYDDA